MTSRVLNRKRNNQPLRMDHSEMHFENERLSEELEDTVDTIHRYKHRQFISRAFEIMELKKTLTAFQAMTKANQKQKNGLPHKGRPTSSFSSVVKVNVRLPVETADGESDNDSDLSSSDDDSSGRSRKIEYKSGFEKAKNIPQGRSSPSEVYAKMLVSRQVPQRRPATSLPTMSSTSTRLRSKPLRAKSAFPRSTTTETATVIPLNGRADSTDKGMKLICNRRVKSASMSVRRLKEMCHEDPSASDDMQCDVIQARLEKARLESERLQVRVNLFLKSLDEWKSGKNKKSIRTYY